MEQPVYHIPALLDETMAGLAVKPDGTYVDVTYGGGGHSRAILERLGPDGKLIGMDQDMDAWENRLHDDRFTFAHGNFAYVKNFLRYYGVDGVDGILADLGVSFHHFDAVERGFTFRADAPLDMRMNREAKLNAEQVVNSYPEEELERILRLYGEVDGARNMARLIGQARAQSPIRTTGDLDRAIARMLPGGAEHKVLAKVYQALRIEVNQEMRSLEKFLDGATRSLKEGGRLVVITYHSLEDRMVKNFIKTGNVEGKTEEDIYGKVQSPLAAVSRKPVLPAEEEIAANTRARSAKLRIAEKRRADE